MIGPARADLLGGAGEGWSHWVLPVSEGKEGVEFYRLWSALLVLFNAHGDQVPTGRDCGPDGHALLGARRPLFFGLGFRVQGTGCAASMCDLRLYIGRLNPATAGTGRGAR